MDKLERAFGEWVLRYRVPIILACVALLFAVFPYGKAPKPTTDYRVFFSKQNPELREFINLENTYSKQDNVLFVITPKNGNVYTRETLAAIHSLSNELRAKKGLLWTLPGIQEVNSMLYSSRSINGQAKALFERDYKGLSPDQLKQLRQVASEDKSSAEAYLINPTATESYIDLKIALPANDLPAQIARLKSRLDIVLEQARLKDNTLRIAADWDTFRDQLKNAAGKPQTLRLTLSHADESSVFTQDHLEVLDFLSNELRVSQGMGWSLPYSKRVDAINTFRDTTANGDDLNTQILVENPDKLSDADLQKIRRVVEAEPSLMGRVVNKQGSVTAVNVVVNLPGKDATKEVPEVVKEARRIKQYIERVHPSVTVRLTGMVMFNNGFSEASTNDVKRLYPLALLFITLFLLFLTRSFVSVFLTLVVIFLSIFTAMSLAILLHTPLTPPSMSAPIVILTVAVASSVHILVSFVHQIRYQQMGKIEAIKESLRINIVPVFVTSLTTAIGFLTLNFSEVPPFQHLGNIVAAGVVASFIFAAFLLPALLSFLPVLIKPKSTTKKTVMYRFGDWVVTYRKALFWSMLVLILALIALIPRNVLNEVFLEYFDKSLPIRQDMDYSIKNLSGQYILEYSIDSGKKMGITKPEFLRDVDKFIVWLRSDENKNHVRHVYSFIDNIKRINRTMHAEKPEYYRVPRDHKAASDYVVAFYSMTVPFGMDAREQIESVNYSSMRVTISMNTVSTREMIAFEDRVQQWLKKNTTTIKQARGSGPTMMFTRISRRNVVSMLIGTSLALVLISFILIIAFRSFKFGMISMIPNLVPAAMGFGIWALIDGEIGLALSIVTGLTLGIIVDDTIHFLSKYLRARRELKTDAAESVRYAFHTVGYALVTTSIVLVAGFMIIAMSLFKLNSDMGILTSIVIGVALLADFLFLPPLLMKLEGKSNA